MIVESCYRVKFLFLTELLIPFIFSSEINCDTNAFRICCVSLVSTRKEARWSFRFFSLFTVDDEEYVQQTNKQN